MTPLGFEPTVSAGERSQTYALDRADICKTQHTFLEDCFSQCVSQKSVKVTNTVIGDNKVFMQRTKKNLNRYMKSRGDRGSTVAKVLCYKSKGRWFDPSWCQSIFH